MADIGLEVPRYRSRGCGDAASEQVPTFQDSARAWSQHRYKLVVLTGRSVSTRMRWNLVNGKSLSKGREIRGPRGVLLYCSAPYLSVVLALPPLQTIIASLPTIRSTTRLEHTTSGARTSLPASLH